MATKYYYADVRRYIVDGKLDPSVSELLNKEELKQDTVTTNTLYKIFYLTDVYETENANFTAWRKSYPLEGTIVPSTNNGPAGFNLIFTPGEGADFVNVGKFVDQSVSGKSHTKIAFSRKGGATSGQVFYTPKFTIGWKSNAAPNLTNVQINWRNADNTTNDAPNIIWSTAKKAPNPPLEKIKQKFPEISVIASATAELTLQKIEISATDNKTWYFIVHHKTKNYNELWTCDLNGESFTQLSRADDKVLSSKASIDKWNAKVAADFLARKSLDVVATDVTYKDVPTYAPKGDYRYNPPPYDNKSRTSMGQKAEYEDNDTFKNLAIFPEKTIERGLIYQDVNGAKVLNRNPEKLKQITTETPGLASNQWGFRFMYNPTTFSYSSSSNNSVDWTLGSKDPATLLVGNSNVTFELYLNRIPDLKYLRMSGTPRVTQEQLYGRKLEDYEVEGILNRGTEYDLEFLYRVLNGDPLNKPLLFDKQYGGASADFGFTTATPCWLQLNKNLKYFGSVASLQVNHVMFDLNMIPMLSTVSITFVRYPALWTATGLGEAVKAGVIKSNIISTEKAPG